MKVSAKVLLIVGALITVVGLGSTFAFATGGVMNDTVYQLTNPTSNGNKLALTTAELGSGGYTQSDQIFLASNDTGTNLVAAKRLYKSSTGDYMTESSSSRISSALGSGYVDTGVAFYVSASKTTASQPVYRYVLGNMHRYALSKTDQGVYAANGWTQEGISFYAVPTVADASDFTSGIMDDTAYQITNSSNGAALITMSAGEAVSANLKYGYNGSDELFQASQNSGTGLVKVTRYYSSSARNFLTESNPARIPTTGSYVNQSVAYYASATKTAETQPVYRFQKGAQHRYALSPSDQQALLSTGWTQDGISFYAVPTEADAPQFVTPTATAPAAPTSPTFASVTATTLTVNWTAPADGGSAITGYKLFRNGVQIASPTSTTYSDSGLTAATAYTYHVVATNAIGDSASGVSGSVNTSTTVPGAPTAVSAVAGDASATVSFTAPTSNGGATITGYTVSSVPAGGVDTNAGSTDLNHVITGLSNGTSYTFTVTATNSQGTSVASVASNIVTPQAPIVATTPSAPASPTFASVTATTLTVNWTAPADGGSAITGYKLFRNGVQIASPTSTTYIDSGLTAATAYTYYVVATNAIGDSASGASGSVTTSTVTTVPVTDGIFGFAVFPDTQLQALPTAGTQYDNQMNDVVSKITSEDLRFALSVGDVINAGASPYDTSAAGTTYNQIGRMSNAFQILNNGGLPYTIAFGNHDTAAVCNSGSACNPTYTSISTNTLVRDTTAVNSALSGRLAADGVYQAGRLENSYKLYEAEGAKWMVLSIELWPRQAVLDWAKQVVSSHPQHNVIVVSHSLLNSDGSINTSNGGYGSLSSQAVYNQLIFAYPNVKLAFSGHVNGTTVRVDNGAGGNKVTSVLSSFHSGDFNPTRFMSVDVLNGTISTKIRYSTKRAGSTATDPNYQQYDQTVSGLSFIRS